MSLRLALADVLTTVAPREKAARARAAVTAWQVGDLKWGAAAAAPISPWPDPATRDAPPLAPPSAMRKRGLGSVAGRCALLHAVAHIELNAIDLAVDMVGRFSGDVPDADRPAFIADWLSVADDEARHFVMVADQLAALGAAYGDLPAHDGLWQAATRTHHDVLGRLAIAPLVLEARGLDVTPAMVAGLTREKDAQSAAVLQQIYDEEIGHVAIGTKWFRKACAWRALDPEATFADQVAQHFPGGLKPPFNHDARTQSDFPRDWYEGLANL